MPDNNSLFCTEKKKIINIIKLLEIVLVFSSIYKKGFSALKIIKSDWPSRSIEGPSLQEYNAVKALLYNI